MALFNREWIKRGFFHTETQRQGEALWSTCWVPMRLTLHGRVEAGSQAQADPEGKNAE